MNVKISQAAQGFGNCKFIQATVDGVEYVVYRYPCGLDVLKKSRTIGSQVFLIVTDREDIKQAIIEEDEKNEQK